jgi:hypothetical protein
VPSDLILLDHEQIGSALVSDPDHCMGYALWAVPFVPTASVLCLAVALRSSASMVLLPPLADCAASLAAIPDPAPAPNLVVMPDPAADALVFFVPSGSTASASAPTHPTTCLQNNIKKPKVYTDATVRYVCLTTSGEPENTYEALSNSKWQEAMDEQYSALMKKKHGISCHPLVPLILLTANGSLRSR